jgi:hypothetical protein
MSRMTYLDKKIKLAFDCTVDVKLTDDLALEIFQDTSRLADGARELRPYGRNLFVARSKLILVVLGRLKRHLIGKPLDELHILEDELLTAVTQKT